jgi:hypothetical protein
MERRANDGHPRSGPLKKLVVCLMACASLLVSITGTAQASGGSVLSSGETLRAGDPPWYPPMVSTGW